jgi:hypothetical protein
MGDYTSDFLFAQPSFLTGIARIFDFSGSINLYNFSQTPEQADLRAIQNDWAMVGQDLNTALIEYGKQTHPERTTK